MSKTFGKNVFLFANISDTLFDQKSLVHLEAVFQGGDKQTTNGKGTSQPID